MSCSNSKPTSTVRLDGKTVIITGATAGIGVETARDMARRGAKVIIGARNSEKAEGVVKDIVGSTGNNNVHVLKLDLASLQSVKDFADEVKKTETNVHVLINNAGLVSYKRTLTEDGFESTFQCNYLSHFLLTMLLLDPLKQSAPSRIVNVSARVYKRVKQGINFDDINFEKNFAFWPVYSHSKLAQVILTRKLAKILKNDGVSVFSLHPGVIKTELSRVDESTPTVIKVLSSTVKPIISLVGKTVEQGAQTTIHCAVTEGLEELSGSYFADCKVEKLLPHATDDAAAERLWAMSNEMVKTYLD